MMPFVIKAYEFNIPDTEKAKLFAVLESLVLRHRIIGTRAHLEDRIKQQYSEFTKENPSVNSIIDHIRWFEKETDESWWWWQYWSDVNFKNALQGGLDHSLAKHLLWKYENYLLSREKQGYSFIPMSQIIKPELEHIAPQTPTDGTPIAAGYCKYDDEFMNNYLNCIGNYLLISKSHNCSIGNVPFKEKRASYNVLEQQREIQKMTENRNIWNKDCIRRRKEKIISFILEEL